jgi:phosphatidyl-myo-inositol alpha-mannosyltransferase
MRIALVSPCSWSYPGGVTRHIDALAKCFRADGHDVGVLAPFDPYNRLSALLHRGIAPQPMVPPEYLIPLGRTAGIRANGAVSNLSLTAESVLSLRHHLRARRFDVVHIPEPVARQSDGPQPIGPHWRGSQRSRPDEP